MLKIKIRQCQGVERADIEGLGIITVAGPNGAGKSSLLRAVGAAITGYTVPVDGLAKSQAGALVRVGASEAGVKVELPDGSAILKWPSAKLETVGKPPQASTLAAGLLDVTTLGEKDRARELARYIQAEPTRKDLAAALEDQKIDVAPEAEDGMTARVWKVIQDGGWDSAHAKAKDKGIKLKGQFEQATGGARWGADKGGKWLPAAWEAGMADASLEQLEQDVKAAAGALEAAIAGQAVDASQVEALKAQAAKAPELEQAVVTAERAEVAAAEAVQAAQAALKALPPADRSEGCACPHCGEHVKVTVSQGVTRLEKAKKQKISDVELKKRTEAAQKAESSIRQAERDLAAARNATFLAKQAVTTAQAAAQKLDGMKGKGTGSADALAKAREALAIAEARRGAWRLKANADMIHAALLQNQAIVALLASDGLRKTALTRALEAFNRDYLAPLCAVSGWKPVEITEDLQPTYGGRSYVLLSKSEQWRVRAILQVAAAKIDGSCMVILDDAEILVSAKDKNGLIALLKEWGGPVLIGMAYAKPELAPDLSAKGLGVTYWVSDAQAAPIGDALGRKAA